MYRRIAENKAKPIKVKTSSTPIFKPKAEFGPWYSQQLCQICQFLAMQYIFLPKVITTVKNVAVLFL